MEPMAYPGSRESSAGLSARGVVVVVAVLLLVAAFFWMGPLRQWPAELRLVAFAPNGEYAQSLALTADIDPDDAQPRAPLILGVHNVGRRPATPSRLRLSVPGHIQLVDRAGQPLPHQPVAGSPLVHYEIPTGGTQPPDAPPAMLPGVDTLWMEPRLRAFECAILGDGVPEFLPAPAYDPALLANVVIFYTLDAGEPDPTHSGILRVQLDPAQLTLPPQPQPVLGPVESFPEEAPRPDMGPLTRAGTRDAVCGDTSMPINLHTIVWRGAEGGLLYEVQVHGRSRRLLFDLEANGTVDLEIWDAAGDGVFRTRREVSFPVPAFLRSLPPARPREVRIVADTLPLDSAWLQRFHAVGEGPFRFAEAVRAAQRLAMPVDTMDPAIADATPPEPPPADTPTVRPQRPPPRLLGVPVDTIRRR
jgi:hypothetical protein